MNVDKIAIQKIAKEKQAISEIESQDLRQRDIRCPNCLFRVQTVFSDARGHIKIKCPKCKKIYVINIAYFRKYKNK